MEMSVLAPWSWYSSRKTLNNCRMQGREVMPIRNSFTVPDCSFVKVGKVLMYSVFTQERTVVETHHNSFLKNSAQGYLSRKKFATHIFSPTNCIILNNYSFLTMLPVKKHTLGKRY